MNLWQRRARRPAPLNFSCFTGGPKAHARLFRKVLPVAQAFQPVRRTGKMPAPPRTFQGSSSWSFGPPVNHEKFSGAGLRARRCHKLMVRRTHRKTFQNSHSWAFGPPANYEKFGGAGLRARRLWWHRFSTCAPAPVRYRCHQKLFGTDCKAIEKNI